MAHYGDTQMTQNTLLRTANKYLMSDINSAVSASGQLAIILEKIEKNQKLTDEFLEFLNHGCFVALYLLATGEITFTDYLPIAQEEQDERLGTAGKEAQRIRFLGESDEAERERQDFAQRMRERAKAEQLALLEEQRLRIEQQRARKKDPRYQAKTQEVEFRQKYGLDAFIDQDNYPELMKLVRKLDNASRISDEEFIWLSTTTDENYENYLTIEIKNRYHFIEATHMAVEFKRTGDPWHAVNASGHFRKCVKT